ncbi:MAG: ion channel [Syntrophaceae bacterium]
MVIAICLSLILVIISTLIHYEFLRLISIHVDQIRISTRPRILVIIFGAFAAHLLEIFLYAIALFLLHDNFGLGGFGGVFIDSFSTYLYFSTESYTALGMGDIIPKGPLRLLVGIEAINGLLLIAWSASYTYVYMSNYWKFGEGK